MRHLSQSTFRTSSLLRRRAALAAAAAAAAQAQTQTKTQAQQRAAAGVGAAAQISLSPSSSRRNGERQRVQNQQQNHHHPPAAPPAASAAAAGGRVARAEQALRLQLQDAALTNTSPAQAASRAGKIHVEAKNKQSHTGCLVDKMAGEDLPSLLYALFDHYYHFSDFLKRPSQQRRRRKKKNAASNGDSLNKRKNSRGSSVVGSENALTMEEKVAEQRKLDEQVARVLKAGSFAYSEEEYERVLNRISRASRRAHAIRQAKALRAKQLQQLKVLKARAHRLASRLADKEESLRIAQEELNEIKSNRGIRDPSVLDAARRGVEVAAQAVPIARSNADRAQRALEDAKAKLQPAIHQGQVGEVGDTYLTPPATPKRQRPATPRTRALRYLENMLGEGVAGTSMMYGSPHHDSDASHDDASHVSPREWGFSEGRQPPQQTKVRPPQPSSRVLESRRRRRERNAQTRQKNSAASKEKVPAVVSKQLAPLVRLERLQRIEQLPRRPPDVVLRQSQLLAGQSSSDSLSFSASSSDSEFEIKASEAPQARRRRGMTHSSSTNSLAAADKLNKLVRSFKKTGISSGTEDSYLKTVDLEPHYRVHDRFALMRRKRCQLGVQDMRRSSGRLDNHLSPEAAEALRRAHQPLMLPPSIPKARKRATIQKRVFGFDPVEQKSHSYHSRHRSHHNNVSDESFSEDADDDSDDDSSSVQVAADQRHQRPKHTVTHFSHEGGYKGFGSKPKSFAEREIRRKTTRQNRQRSHAAFLLPGIDGNEMDRNGDVEVARSLTHSQSTGQIKSRRHGHSRARKREGKFRNNGDSTSSDSGPSDMELLQQRLQESRAQRRLRRKQLKRRGQLLNFSTGDETDGSSLAGPYSLNKHPLFGSGESPAAGTRGRLQVNSGASPSHSTMSPSSTIDSLRMTPREIDDVYARLTSKGVKMSSAALHRALGLPFQFSSAAERQNMLRHRGDGYAPPVTSLRRHRSVVESEEESEPDSPEPTLLDFPDEYTGPPWAFRPVRAWSDASKYNQFNDDWEEMQLLDVVPIAADREKIKEVLRKNYVALRFLFLFHCSQSGTVAMIQCLGQTGFTHMMRICGVVDYYNVTMGRLDQVFMRVNIEEEFDEEMMRLQAEEKRKMRQLLKGVHPDSPRNLAESKSGGEDSASDLPSIGKEKQKRQKKGRKRRLSVVQRLHKLHAVQQQKRSDAAAAKAATYGVKKEESRAAMALVANDDNPDRQFTLSEFLESLVRVALIKYTPAVLPDIGSSGGTGGDSGSRRQLRGKGNSRRRRLQRQVVGHLNSKQRKIRNRAKASAVEAHHFLDAAGKLSKLLEEHIVPKALVSGTFASMEAHQRFRDRLRAVQLQEVYSKHAEDLYRTFRAFTIRHSSVIPAQVFAKFLRTYNLIGEELSRRSALTAFSLSRDENVNKVQADYPSFLELLARLADVLHNARGRLSKLAPALDDLCQKVTKIKSSSNI